MKKDIKITTVTSEDAEVTLPILIEKEFKDWSDREFVVACQAVNSLPFFKKEAISEQHCYSKLDLLITLSPGIGIFFPVQRKINGRIYSYGITIADENEATEISDVYVPVMKEFFLKGMREDIKSRCQRSANKLERDTLLTLELEDVKASIASAKSQCDSNLYRRIFWKFYENEKRKLAFPSVSDVLTENKTNPIDLLKFDEQYCASAGLGAATVIFEFELIRMLNDELDVLDLGVDQSSEALPNKNKPTILIDIWNSNEAYAGSYEATITLLKQRNEVAGLTFIVDKGDALYWSKNKPRGQYLAAFLKMCYDEELLVEQLSWTQLQTVILNTFGETFNEGLLKSPWATKNTNQKYLDAFKNYPTLLRSKLPNLPKHPISKHQG